MFTYLLRLTLLSVGLLFITPTITDAMATLGIYKVMSFYDNIGMPENCSGDLNGVSFTLNGEKVKLRTELGFINDGRGRHIGGGYVRLMSQNETKDYLSFPIGKKESFAVQKITTDTGEEFLIVITSVNAVSDSALSRFWLVGKRNNQYITYVTRESLKQAGLLYQSIGCDVTNGEIQVKGYAPIHSRDLYPPGDNRMTYKGHKTRREGHVLYVNQVRLFWDVNAQWFGIRLIDD